MPSGSLSSAHPHQPSTQIQLAICSLFLLLVPCGIWLTNYRWDSLQHIQQAQDVAFSIWHLITHTGSMPYAIATAWLLFTLLWFLCRHVYRWQLIVIMCILSIGVTQISKITLKETFRQPRPYVVAMQLAHTDVFYQKDENGRSQLIATRFPDPEIHHNLQAELGYAFPSGHTIFVASWLLLFAGLLPARHKIWLLPMSLWAVAVAFSRVHLGMHYPSDLAIAIIIAWLWHAILFAHVLPRLQKRYGHKAFR